MKLNCSIDIPSASITTRFGQILPILQILPSRKMGLVCAEYVRIHAIACPARPGSKKRWPCSDIDGDFRSIT